MVGAGHMGGRGDQEFSSGHVELRCLFDTHVSGVGSCVQFSWIEIRDLA